MIVNDSPPYVKHIMPFYFKFITVKNKYQISHREEMIAQTNTCYRTVKMDENEDRTQK